MTFMTVKQRKGPPVADYQSQTLTSYKWVSVWSYDSIAFLRNWLRLANLVDVNACGGLDLCPFLYAKVRTALQTRANNFSFSLRILYLEVDGSVTYGWILSEREDMSPRQQSKQSLLNCCAVLHWLLTWLLSFKIGPQRTMFSGITSVSRSIRPGRRAPVPPTGSTCGASSRQERFCRSQDGRGSLSIKKISSYRFCHQFNCLSFS